MSDKFYEIAIWQPSEEALIELRKVNSSLKQTYDHRNDYVTHVEAISAEHIRPAVLLNDILLQDYATAMNLGDLSDGVDEDDDVDFDEDEEFANHDSSDEHRREKKVSRHVLKQMSSVYKKIQSMCHPDKTHHKQLHKLSVEASLCVERGDLMGLLLIFSEAKARKARLSAVGISSDLMAEYIDLELEIEAHRQAIEDLQGRYDATQYYAQDRDGFLECAMSLAQDDILDTLQLYRANSLKVSQDVIDRLNELNPDLMRTAFHVEKEKPIWFNDNPIDFSSSDSETSDFLKSLFPDEDEDDEA